MMRKKLFAAVICLALLITLLPTTALATPGNRPQRVFVGNQDCNIPYNSTGSASDPNNPTWKLDYTPAEVRLTLNGYKGAAAVPIGVDGDLTIVVQGENQITENYPTSAHGVVSTGNLRIIGDGTLEACTTWSTRNGIDCSGSITIQDATITAWCIDGAGIYAGNGCTIINADVTGVSERGTGVESKAGISIIGAGGSLRGVGARGSIVAVGAISGSIIEPAGGFFGVDSSLFSDPRNTVYTAAGRIAPSATLLAPVPAPDGAGDLGADVPKTGDGAPLLPLCAVALLCGTGLVIRTRKRKRG